MKDRCTSILSAVTFLILLSHFTLQAQWIQTNGPYSGIIKAISSDGNRIAAFSFEIGLFTSSDAGKTWKAANSDSLSRWTNTILVKGDTILVGQSDRGFLISTDNGNTWRKNISGLKENCDIEALIQIGSKTYAGTESGLYKSTDFGMNWNRINVGPSDMLVKSIAANDSIIVLSTNFGIFISLDSDLSWKQSYGYADGFSFGKAMIDKNYIYVAKGYYGDYGILLSTDNGSTWKDINNGLPPYSFIYCLASDGNSIFAGAGFKGIYRSTDQGAHWQPANNGLPEQIINDISASENNIFAGTNASGVYISTDGGSSWNESNNGLSGTWITSLSLKADTIFAGTMFCGIYFSTDIGLSWKRLNIPNYYNYFTGQIAFDSNYIFINSSGDGIIRSSDNGLSWEMANTGITYFRGNIGFIFVYKNNIFTSVYDSPGFKGGLFRSTNHGDQWLQVNPQQLENIAPNSMTSVGDNLFVTVNDKVYVSADDGLNWKSVSNGLNGKEIFLIEANDHTIFAAAHDSGLYRSTDLGTSWKLVYGGLPGPWVTSLAFADSNVVFAGVETKGVYLSVDDGLNWKEVSSNLPQGGPNLYFGNFRDIEVNGGSIFTVKASTIWGRSLCGLIPLIPPVPQALRIKDNSRNQQLNLTLAWKRVGMAEKYRLQLADDSLFRQISVNDSNITSFSKNLKELHEGRNYYWRIKAKNCLGESSWSKALEFTTILFAPDSLKAQMLNNNKVQLSWKDRSDAEKGFIIERKQSEDFIILDTLKADIISYIDSAIVISSQYQYRIKAFNEYVSSVYSSTASIAVTGVSTDKKIPTEYSLLQNYPNPFNPVTIIGYSLPQRSFVEMKICDMLGRELITLISKEQEAGEYNILFNASSLPSGIYIYSIQAGKYSSSRKLMVLK